ncbi:MAG: VacJ family lipoprotein [Lentisphaeria bacterium]|nr:VacJ family lipoprotein [Lentisphaeria bacterium]
MQRKSLYLIFLLSVIFLTGCATRPDFTDNSAGTKWSISETEEVLVGDDPIEPFNRSMFEVNHFAMRWIVRPISWVYCSILPKEVIVRINNVSDNLAFPGRMVSCLCQAKWKGAGISLSRFLINSTVGIAGIFDPADHFLGLKRRHENMGHAFASWGLGPGCVLILPFSGATNVRDQVGWAFDSLLDLKIVIPYAGSVAGANRTISSYDPFNALVESAADPYEQFKLAMSLLRYPQINDYIFKATESDPNFEKRLLLPGRGVDVFRTAHYYKPENPLSDTLRVNVFSMQRTNSRWWTNTSLWNNDFQNLGDVREIRDPLEPEDTEPRIYQFWNEPQKEGGIKRKNELVIIIPGVGTHYTGKMLRAFAEVFSSAGYAVAATTNTMNWSFATTKATAFPGYVPEDVKHIRRHLRLILDDLKKNKQFTPDRIVIVGYSLGALQTLHLAEVESRENTLGASRYVAINPPVDLIYAMEQFERLGDITKKWTKKEYFQNLGHAVVHYLPVAMNNHPHQKKDGKADAEIPFDYIYRSNISPEQAAGLISIAFRMILRELMLSNARNGFLPPEYEYKWGRRTALYKKIDSLTGRAYVETFVKSRYPELTMDQLRFNSGLRVLEKFLKESPDIRVFHNLDDPLISQKDADYLSSTLGKKLLWFDHGAHLGNLYLREYHDKLLSAIGEK